MPAKASVAAGALPIGLASDIRLKQAVAKDQVVTNDDVELSADTQAWRVRAEMLQRFKP
jgi:predicted homoserine dehydrogenase-like protein